MRALPIGPLSEVGFGTDGNANLSDNVDFGLASCAFKATRAIGGRGNSLVARDDVKPANCAGTVPDDVCIGTSCEETTPRLPPLAVVRGVLADAFSLFSKSDRGSFNPRNGSGSASTQPARFNFAKVSLLCCLLKCAAICKSSSSLCNCWDSLRPVRGGKIVSLLRGCARKGRRCMEMKFVRSLIRKCIFFLSLLPLFLSVRTFLSTAASKREKNAKTGRNSFGGGMSFVSIWARKRRRCNVCFFFFCVCGFVQSLINNIRCICL